MYLAGMPPLDIISSNLEFRNSAYPGSRAEEYIGLIDTCRHVSIWLVDSRHSFDSRIRPIFGDDEERERALGIVSYGISCHMKCGVVDNKDACTGKRRTGSNVDMSCILSSK